MGGKGARLTQAQNAKALKRAVEIYGSKCMIPDCLNQEESLPYVNLTLHHKDGNGVNHMLSNLEPAHFKCNNHWQKVARTSTRL